MDNLLTKQGDVRTSRIFLNKKGLVKVVPFMQSVDDITSY